MSVGTLNNTTATITNMLNCYAGFKMLMRALPFLTIEKFGQTFVLPNKSTKIAKFRRFEALDATPTALVEGVTPASLPLTTTDITAEVVQYGNLIMLTDVLLDTADSPVMEQATMLAGEQAAETIENMRLGVLLGGSNVEYANGAARTDVNTPLTLNLQRRISRKLKRQKARHLTDYVKSTPRFYSESISPCFVAIVHPDCEADIRNMTHFQDAKDYGNNPMWENEIGAVEGVRYLFTTMMPIYADAGGARTSADGKAMVSTTGVKADVYPVLYIAKDAYGIIPLKGAESLSPIIVNPTPSAADPLAQRAYIGWKTMQTCIILNQAWMVRAEVAVSSYENN